MLSFLTELPSYYPIEFPMDYPIIAVFYADVDSRGSGQITYRTTSDPDLLKRVQNDLKLGFPGARRFQPIEVFIATWNEVGYYEEKSNKVMLSFVYIGYFLS